MWKNAVRKAGFGERQAYNNSIERFTVHPHVLRKFFRTRIGSVIPVDVTEALMGHEGYLTEVYRRYNEEDLANFYLQGEPSLLIFTEAGEVSRLRKKIEERNRQLQTLVNGLTAENLELKERVKGLEVRMTGLEAKMKEFFKELVTTLTIDLSIYEVLKDKGVSIDMGKLREKLLKRLQELNGVG